MLTKGWSKWALLACTVVSAAPAVAQTGADVAEAQDRASKPSAEQTGGLEDIVVTATRREERLQNIPVTVSAITANTLGGAGIVEVRSLTQVVPGLNGARNLSVNLPVIRGVGSSGVTVGDESNVATYIDGIYQADPFSTSLELVEVERVEVLKGPQGTVFGRNATGGLINIITPDPKFEAHGRISAKYGRMRGDANDYDLRAYITGPLTSTIAADLAALYRKNDGYIKNLASGGYLGRTRVIDLRSKLLFQPSDSARIILTGQYADSNDQTTAAQPFNNNSAGLFDPPLVAGGAPIPVPNVILPTRPWQTSLSFTPRTDYERYNLSLRSQFEFDGFNLETSTGYMNAKNAQDADSDSSNIYRGSTLITLKSDTFSQEVRLLSNGAGRLKWIVGAYYFNLDGSMDIALGGAPRSTVPPSFTFLAPEVKTTSWAGFAEGTYELTDTFFVTVGGRYSSEKRKLRQALNGVSLVAPAPGFDTDGVARKSFNKWTYRIALRYNFADDANLYASYGTGFKSGVFNGLGFSGVATDPEEIKAWEVGVKADPLPWLRTNISAYYYDYTDLQVNARAPGGLAFLLQNAATAEIYGAELEVTAAPTDDLQIRTAIAYTHANYKDFPDSPLFVALPQGGNLQTTTDASGNQMTRAPRFTFNLGFNWGRDFAGGRIGISGNLFHSAKVYHDFANTLMQKSHQLLNGEISWTTPDENLRFFLWGTNLTNAKVAQQISPGALGTYVVYERPRRLGIGAQFKF